MTFHGLRLPGAIIGALAGVLDIAAVVSLINSVRSQEFAPGWLVLVIPLALMHLLAAFAWSLALVREPGRSRTTVWGRTLVSIDDAQVARFGRAENEIRLIADDGRECAITVSFGVRAEAVLAAYADLIGQRPKLLADVPHLRRIADQLPR